MHIAGTKAMGKTYIGMKSDLRPTAYCESDYASFFINR